MYSRDHSMDLRTTSYSVHRTPFQSPEPLWSPFRLYTYRNRRAAYLSPFSPLHQGHISLLDRTGG